MDLFQLVIVLLLAVLLSTAIAQLIPRVASPLVQIAIGAIVAMTLNTTVDVSLDPDIFLVIFIAPLLFKEAKNVDRLGFWQNRKMIVSLALGLVVATMLAVGVAAYAMVPAWPLALALALGAALGPTDAIAVSSLGSAVKMEPEQKSILSGESLINDASGLVAFQFALTLALTGEFSVTDIASTFALEFFGGLALGIAIGFVSNLIMRGSHAIGLDNRRFHVLFEVVLPFVAYMAGDMCHVSGVLTVVACGVVFSVSSAQSGSVASKVNIVSSSVWDVLSFALNGIVFVLLGMMLPEGMLSHLDEVSEINWELIGVAVAIAIIVVACRFVWVMIMEAIHGAKLPLPQLARHAAVISCAGAKGAITLSIVMTVPYTVAIRSDMVFVASSVVLITLLVANFVTPLLAPADEGRQARIAKEREVHVKIMRRVIEMLAEESEEVSAVDKMACHRVMAEYADRIDYISQTDSDGFNELRIAALERMVDEARKIEAAGECTHAETDDFVDECQRRLDAVEESSERSWRIARAGRRTRTWGRALLKAMGVKDVKKPASPTSVVARCHRSVVEWLTELAYEPSEYREEDVAMVLVEYQKKLADVAGSDPSVTQFIRTTDRSAKFKAKALRYEQELVHEAYDDGELDRSAANRIRRQIAAIQIDEAGDL